MYDYIFLDLDGTILEGKYKHYKCYTDTVNILEGIPLDINIYWEMKRKRVSLDKILEYSDLRGDKETFLKIWKQRIEKAEYLMLDYLKPNIEVTLSRLKKDTKKLWLVTNRFEESSLDRQLEKFGIKHNFDKIICTKSSEEDSKFQILSKLEYNKAILIGDTEADRRTAEMLNIEFVGISNGLRTPDVFNGTDSYEELYLVKLGGGLDE